MVETWLYHYDAETKQQSMDWGITAQPAPKNSESKNPPEKISPRFLGSRRHPPHLLSSKGPNYQSGVLFISAGAVEGNLEGKTLEEVHQGCLVLSRQCAGSLGTCNPEETGLPGFRFLDHPPYSPDLSPSDYHLFPGLKSNWNVTIFIRRGDNCCRRNLVGRKTFRFFFEWLAKFRAKG